MMHTGDCITSHVARPPTFHSERGRREIAEENRRRADRSASGENEKRLSSTWIGSGAEKELPARRRSARTNSLSLSLPGSLALSPYGNREIHTRPFPPVCTPETPASFPRPLEHARFFFAIRARRKCILQYIMKCILQYIWKIRSFLQHLSQSWNITTLEYFYYYKNYINAFVLLFTHDYVYVGAS